MLPLNGYFHEAESVHCFFLSQLPWFNAFNAGWCFVRIVFNALHLPMNHKTIKTEKERNSETHYAFLSAVDLLSAVDTVAAAVDTVAAVVGFCIHR